jgi:hypothetical protein
VKALEGKAKSAREWELLIESHRALGNMGAAEGHMREYLERFPNRSMGETYRRQLAYRRAPASESSAVATAPDPVPASPQPRAEGPRDAPPPADPAPPPAAASSPGPVLPLAP